MEVIYGSEQLVLSLCMNCGAPLMQERFCSHYCVGEYRQRIFFK